MRTTLIAGVALLALAGAAHAQQADAAAGGTQQTAPGSATPQSAPDTTDPLAMGAAKAGPPGQDPAAAPPRRRWRQQRAVGSSAPQSAPDTSDPLAMGAAKAGPPSQDPSVNQPRGPLTDVGQTLADHGIRFRSLFTSEPADSLAGGVRQTYDTVSQLYVGVDLNFEQMFGWKGASFHATEYRDIGESLHKNNSGTFTKQQDIYKNEFTQLHLGLVSFEQKLLNNKLDVIIGRLGSTAYFGHLVPGCYFQGGETCGIPTIMNSETGFTLLPSATWGSNIKYKFTPHTYVDFGAFEINPFIAHTSGFTWGTHYATGYSTAIEAGYENTDLRKTAYPTEYKIGYYNATADRNDPFYNTNMQSIALKGGTPLIADSMRQGMWIMGSRTVWRPDLSKPQNITLFGGYVQPFESQEVLDRQIFTGLLWRGPFKGRSADTIGVTMTYFHVSQLERDFLRDSRIKAGGPNENSYANEFASEINYGIQLTNSIRVTPNFQYIIHPDNANLPKINFRTNNLAVIGVKLVVDLNKLLGLPPSSLGD